METMIWLVVAIGVMSALSLVTSVYLWADFRAWKRNIDGRVIAVETKVLGQNLPAAPVLQSAFGRASSNPDYGSPSPESPRGERQGWLPSAGKKRKR